MQNVLMRTCMSMYGCLPGYDRNEIYLISLEMDRKEVTRSWFGFSAISTRISSRVPFRNDYSARK